MKKTNKQGDAQMTKSEKQIALFAKAFNGTPATPEEMTRETVHEFPCECGADIRPHYTDCPKDAE